MSISLNEFMAEHNRDPESWPDNYPLGQSCIDADFFLNLGVIKIVEHGPASPGKTARVLFLENGAIIVETSFETMLVG